MFTTRMPVVRRVDVANVIIDVLCPDGRDTEHRRSKLIEISVKPGEKVYEELMREEETSRAQGARCYFVVLPAFRTLYSAKYHDEDNVGNDNLRLYESSVETILSHDEMKQY